MALNNDFIVKNGLVVKTTATILSGINSTSTNSGALVITGGAGIGGALFIGNTATIISTSSSISTNTGALIVQGGVGVGGNIYTAGRIGFVSTSNVSVVYQVYNSTANSLDTIFG